MLPTPLSQARIKAFKVANSLAGESSSIGETTQGTSHDMPQNLHYRYPSLQVSVTFHGSHGTRYVKQRRQRR